MRWLVIGSRIRLTEMGDTMNVDNRGGRRSRNSRKTNKPFIVIDVDAI
jgi:hypothetical protein